MNKLLLDNRVPSALERRLMKEVQENFALSGFSLTFTFNKDKWHPKLNGKLIPTGFEFLKDAISFSNKRLNIYSQKRM